MKKAIYFMMSMVLCLAIASCGKTLTDGDDVAPVNPISNPDEITKTVTLQLCEEQVSVTAAPLTRAGGESTQEVYGINVYKANSKGAYEKYAYGLFNDPEAISIVLKEGEKYKFECTVLRDDEDKVYHDGLNYKSPFLHGGTKTTLLENKFLRSTSENLDGLARGESHLDATTSTIYPRTYRYYGVLEDFDPASSDKIEIKVNRAIFGLHFIITPPTDGTARIDYLPDLFEKYFTISAGDATYDHQSIYTFNHMEPATALDFTAESKMTITWTHADGTIDTSTRNITIGHNMMTTVKIDFTGPQASKLSIQEENDAMIEKAVDWHVTSN